MSGQSGALSEINIDAEATCSIIHRAGEMVVA